MQLLSTNQRKIVLFFGAKNIEGCGASVGRCAIGFHDDVGFEQALIGKTRRIDGDSESARKRAAGRFERDPVERVGGTADVDCLGTETVPRAPCDRYNLGTTILG